MLKLIARTSKFFAILFIMFLLIF